MTTGLAHTPDIRIGVIGAGRWGRNVIRTLKSLSGARLEAVVSKNSETPNIVGDGCRVHADMQGMLNHTKLDGVVICTPAATHFDIAHDFLDAGIPVFIEKPLTLDPAQANTLVRLAVAVGTWGMVDHIHLFSGAFQKLLKALPEIEPITAIRSIAGNAGPVRNDADVLWDWGPHDVAMMLRIMNDVIHAESAIKSLPGDASEITLRLVFPNNIHATAVLSNGRAERIREFEVEGVRGLLRYIDTGAARTCILENADAPAKTLLHETATPLKTALETFVAGIKSDAPSINNLAFGADVVRILAAADGREAL